MFQSNPRDSRIVSFEMRVQEDGRQPAACLRASLLLLQLRIDAAAALDLQAAEHLTRLRQSHRPELAQLDLA